MMATEMLGHTIKFIMFILGRICRHRYVRGHCVFCGDIDITYDNGSLHSKHYLTLKPVSKPMIEGIPPQTKAMVNIEFVLSDRKDISRDRFSDWCIESLGNYYNYRKQAGLAQYD